MRMTLKSAYCRRQALPRKNVSYSFRWKSDIIQGKEFFMTILKVYFRKYFKRQCDEKPELVFPESYTFVLRTTNEAMDEWPLKSAAHSQKNNKCKGTGKMHNEELKFTSKTLLLRILALMNIICNLVRYLASFSLIPFNKSFIYKQEQAIRKIRVGCQ